MKNSPRSAPWAVAALTLFVGCESKDEKPRGTGASGNSLAVLAAPQLDIEKFFTYTPPQSRVVELMSRPFAEVVKTTGAAHDNAAKDLLDKLKAGWDELSFVRKKEGMRSRYRVQLDTTAGELVIDFFEGFSPDVVRNFIARANAKAFDGLPISLEDDALVFGTPLPKNAYTLPARPVPTPRPKGAVFAFLAGDRSAGDRFGISLKTTPSGGSKVSLFGFVANPSKDTLFGDMVEQLSRKPGSILIKGSKTQTFNQPIFQGMDVVLPKLGKDGELEGADIPAFTGVGASQVFGAGHDGHDHENDALIDADLGGSTIQSKNPNVPKKSSNPSKPNPP